MHVRLHSLVLSGLSGQVIDVEVDVSAGFPNFLLVGLADPVVQEAKERVRAAIKNSGFRFPDGRVTVSLFPSELRKEGPWFDFPIALGMLLASKQIKDPVHLLDRAVVIGELGLDGSIRPTGRELAGAMALRGTPAPLLLSQSAIPMLGGTGASVAGAGKLSDVARHLIAGSIQFSPTPAWKPPRRPEHQLPQIAGLAAAERAVQIALTGRHHLLLYGPPGTGKTLLAQYAREWAPDLTADEYFDVGRIWSAHGQKPDFSLSPPFRSPHHTASRIALVGGGHPIRPGEVSLAHHGILFLDEFPEFQRDALEALREPMQERSIRVSRAQESEQFPADCQVLAALNPCPCGFFGDPDQPCKCPQHAMERYRRKLSGPLLDRFGLAVRVERVSVETLLYSKMDAAESPLTVRRKIQSARARLTEPPERHRYTINSATKQLLADATKRFHLSPRAIISTLSVGQSIAALDQRRVLEESDVAEALQYRWRGWET